MKADQTKSTNSLTLFLSFLILFLMIPFVVNAKGTNFKIHKKSIEIINTSFEEVKLKLEEDIRKASIVYDNMTMDELSDKLERSLNSTLKGKGRLFASYSIELGLDPYLALAIVLHETGCSYNCSGLVNTHYNLGGLKGSNGKYLAFNSLDDGIKGYLDILYKNYYSKGLTTPELMNPKYAESTTWANRVNWYIQKIKAK